MNAAGRLAVYGAGLVVAFGGAFVAAGAVIPDSMVQNWSEGSTEASTEQHGEVTAVGLSLASEGYVLSPVAAPTTVDTDGQLSFTILDPAGEPVTEFTEEHEKDLHLIVVRSDGTQFSHVHPELDPATGTWSLPWAWDQAGAYRVYADFTPAAEGAEGLTLTRTVDVAGDMTPIHTEPSSTDEVDGYTVSLEGDLTVGSSSELMISVQKDGRDVTTLEPYLGAYGHLVALREGDLAYLHVHAEGEDPVPGQTVGPEIAFAAEAPTAGSYLLYLDFQVGGEVHTAQFVVDAEQAGDTETEDVGEHPGGH